MTRQRSKAPVGPLMLRKGLPADPLDCLLPLESDRLFARSGQSREISHGDWKYGDDAVHDLFVTPSTPRVLEVKQRDDRSNGNLWEWSQPGTRYPASRLVCLAEASALG